MAITGIKEKFVIGSLAPTLGFLKDLPAVVPRKDNATPVTIFATSLPNLIRYKELYVCMDEGFATGENIHNSLPSTLLRAIPVGQEQCNTGKSVESLVYRQWRKLALGTLSGIKLNVRDEKQRQMPFVYLSYVLEIRQKKKR